MGKTKRKTKQNYDKPYYEEVNFTNKEQYIEENYSDNSDSNMIYESNNLIENNPNYTEEDEFLLSFNNSFNEKTYSDEGFSISEDRIYNIQTTTKKENKIINRQINNIKNYKVQIFYIQKVKQRDNHKDKMKKGRKTKNNKTPSIHNKFTTDNIIRRIKIRFAGALVEFANKLFDIEMIKQGKIINEKNEFIKPLNAKIVRQIAIEYNISWFKMKLKEYLASNISLKFKNYEIDYNKKQIEEIMEEEGMNNLKQYLNLDIKTVYIHYIQIKPYNPEGGMGDILKGFKKLEDDMKEIKIKDNNDTNIDKYLEKFRKTALNLEEYFINKSKGNKKK